MPNYCSNILTFTGDSEVVKKALASVASSDSVFDFNKVIPYPKEFADRDKEYRQLGRDDYKAKYGTYKDGFNSGGYEWCTDNWGTKWTALDPVVNDNTITFQTAWSPPLPIVRQVHVMNPQVNIDFEYDEPGMCFAGRVQYNGVQDPANLKEGEVAPGTPVVDDYFEGEAYAKEFPDRVIVDEDDDEVPDAISQDPQPEETTMTKTTPAFDFEKEYENFKKSLRSYLEKVAASSAMRGDIDELMMAQATAVLIPVLQAADAAGTALTTEQEKQLEEFFAQECASVIEQQIKKDTIALGDGTKDEVLRVLGVARDLKNGRKNYIGDRAGVPAILTLYANMSVTADKIKDLDIMGELKKLRIKPDEIITATDHTFIEEQLLGLLLQLESKLPEKAELQVHTYSKLSDLETILRFNTLPHKLLETLSYEIMLTMISSRRNYLPAELGAVSCVQDGFLPNTSRVTLNAGQLFDMLFHYVSTIRHNLYPNDEDTGLIYSLLQRKQLNATFAKRFEEVIHEAYKKSLRGLLYNALLAQLPLLAMELPMLAPNKATYLEPKDPPKKTTKRKGNKDVVKQAVPEGRAV